MTASPSSHLRGIGLMIAAMALFSIMGICIRVAGDHLAPVQMVFLRNAICLLLLYPAMRWQGMPIRNDRMGSHLMIAISALIAMCCWFYALTIMPLAEATALSFLTPIYVTIGGVLFLGETAGIRRWAAVGFGFIGGLIIIRPGMGVISPGTGFVLLSSLGMAFNGVLRKHLTRREPVLRIVFYMGLFLAPMSLPFAIYSWKPLTFEVLPWALGLGISSTAAHLCLTHALRIAPVTLLMPFDFTRLLFIGTLAWWMFGETVDSWTILGAGVIITSSAYIAHREARKTRAARELLEAEQP